MSAGKRITIGLSTHRPETLPFAALRMRGHEAIVLEEAGTAGFEEMLAGALSIEDYLEGTDLEYPEFSRRSCELFRQLHRDGKRLFQVEPYLDQLNAIHELFIGGGKPRDILAGTEKERVYAVERDYGAALLAYYERCLSAPFDEVVGRVKRFAREDARRTRLRDRMRAEAIALLAPPFESIYVEAGLLHLSLLNRLTERLPQYCNRPAYLMAPVVRPLSNHRQALGPGDKLTLHYIYRPEYDQPRADLLAAQSLIYTKIIIKQEMTGSQGSYPHTLDETASSALVRRLDYGECGALYARIKHKGTQEARAIVRAYIDSQENRTKGAGT